MSDSGKSTETIRGQCSLCGQQTPVVVNIRFARRWLCDECCLSITKQTVAALVVHQDEHGTSIRGREET